MKSIELQKSVVYGPIVSRRFGRSLGINLLPTDCKVCNFSCVYCQYADHNTAAATFPSLEHLASELERVLIETKNYGPEPDWIMFSGNGEPTLYPDFLKAVQTVTALRDKYLPWVTVGILSNSSTCHRPEIRRALSHLDGRFMKLDAGNLYEFAGVNRPVSNLIWGDVIQGLCQTPSITIQSLFVTGAADNTTPRAIDDWIEAVMFIKPLEVQIYTLDRNPQVSELLPVSSDTLYKIAKRLEAKSLVPASVYFSE